MRIHLQLKLAMPAPGVAQRFFENFAEWKKEVLLLDPTARFIADPYHINDPDHVDRPLTADRDGCALRADSAFMVGRWYGTNGYGYVLDYNPAKSEKQTVAQIRKAYVEALTIAPRFDGPLSILTSWMEQLGWSYVDVMGDHVDFYGEGRDGFLKVTWKKIKDGLWKSVRVEDVKFPNGYRLEARKN